MNTFQCRHTTFCSAIHLLRFRSHQSYSDSSVRSLSFPCSLQGTQSRCLRAQPSCPMAPRAWLHGMLLSTWQSGPLRTQQPSLTGDLGAQGRALRQVGAGTVVNTGPRLPLRTVLELGSGAGLTGLAICKACYPRAFIFSDCHDQVLEQLRGNVLLNGFSLEPHTPTDSRSPKVTVAELDWDKVTASQLSAFQADVVIAAGNPSSSTQAGGSSGHCRQEHPRPPTDVPAHTPEPQVPLWRQLLSLLWPCP